jgi:hypothetical protein
MVAPVKARDPVPPDSEVDELLADGELGVPPPQATAASNAAQITAVRIRVMGPPKRKRYTVKSQGIPAHSRNIPLRDEVGRTR